MRSAAAIAELLIAGIVPNLAYLAMGIWLLRSTPAPIRGVERLALAYALGTGVASLAILLLRGFDVPIPMGWLGLLVLSIPFALTRDRSVSPVDRVGWVRAVDIASVAVASLTFVAALAPETYWDGFEYHLPMIRAWVEGPIRALPAMLDAEFRAGIDLLYVPAVSAGQADAAAAVSACFAMALAALIRAQVSRVTSPGAGSLAGLFVLVAPLTIDQAASTYVDLGVGVYGFLALTYADQWNRGGASSALLWSAAFAALAANAKLHAAVLCPAIAVLLLLGGRIPPWVALRNGVALFAALIAPWFVKAGLTTGNPMFPLLGEIWGYGPSTPGLMELRRFRLSTDFPVERDFGGFFQYIYSIHFGRNPHVSGLIGPLPLALGPFALVPFGQGRLSRASAVLAAVIALLFVLQFWFIPALRFGVPILSFLVVAAAIGGCRIAASGRVAAMGLSLVLVLLLTHHLASAVAVYFPRVSALQAPEAYKQARFPDQVALAQMVERASPVVGIPKGAIDWMPKPVYNLHWERNGELYFERAKPSRALALLRMRGVESLVLDVESPHPADGATGHPVVDQWIRSGIAELHVDPSPPAARKSKVWVRVDLSKPRSRPLPSLLPRPRRKP